MTEFKNKAFREQITLRSQFVTLTVERNADGGPRLVLDGPYMDVSGFEPGCSVEAIIQPNLISILNAE